MNSDSDYDPIDDIHALRDKLILNGRVSAAYFVSLASLSVDDDRAVFSLILDIDKLVQAWGKQRRAEQITREKCFEVLCNYLVKREADEQGLNS